MKPYRIGIGVSKISVIPYKSCCNYQKLQYKGILLSDLVISLHPRRRCHKESGGKTCMKKRIFASALAVLMVLSLCACGGNAASSAATSSGSAAPEETKAAQEATSPAEAASAGEASTNEAVTEYESIPKTPSRPSTSGPPPATAP